MHYKQAVKAVLDGTLDVRSLPRNNKVRVYLEMRHKPCQCCGETHHPSAMDFHHIDNDQKFYGVSKKLKFRPTDHIMSVYGHKLLKKIKQEAKKCVLLCSNCHRKVHADVISLSDHLPA